MIWFVLLWVWKEGAAFVSSSNEGKMLGITKCDMCEMYDKGDWPHRWSQKGIGLLPESCLSKPPRRP